MQLIRAINKSNKSNNNNNQTSSSNNNKVVIVAPPTRSSLVSQSRNGNSGQGGVAPVSPSVALPALKKRTSIVKQSMPPPVPPRGSPRSKSNLIGVSSRNRRNRPKPKATINVDRLSSLASFEPDGCQKVKQWLETVEVPNIAADDSIPENMIKMGSVKKLIESFAHRDDSAKSFAKGQKVFDANVVVKHRVTSYDSLDRVGRSLDPQTFRTSEGGTDSGIEMSASRRTYSRRVYLHQFSRDGEFV